MRIFNLISAVLVGVVFVGISPGIPVLVRSVDDLRSVRLGFPIPWVVQNLTRYSPPFPYRIGAASPLDNPTQIIWGNFFLSVAITVVTIILILEALRMGWPHSGRKDGR